MSMGIDVGLDKGGKIYIFKANGTSSTAAFKGEAVHLRTQYYNYLIHNKIMA